MVRGGGRCTWRGTSSGSSRARRRTTRRSTRRSSAPSWPRAASAPAPASSTARSRRRRRRRRRRICRRRRADAEACWGAEFCGLFCRRRLLRCGLRAGGWGRQRRPTPRITRVVTMFNQSRWARPVSGHTPCRITGDRRRFCPDSGNDHERAAANSQGRGRRRGRPERRPDVIHPHLRRYPSPASSPTRSTERFVAGI